MTNEKEQKMEAGNEDIEMLKAVGTGVAMANSSEHLKEVADPAGNGTGCHDQL